MDYTSKYVDAATEFESNTTDANFTHSITLKIKTQDVPPFFYYSIFLSVIVFGGTFGNIISFCLFAFRPLLRSQPVSVYICSLAVLDTSLLWVAYGRTSFYFLFKRNIPVIGTMCSIFWFLATVTNTGSSWVNVIMTFDRIIAVFIPFRYKVISAYFIFCFSNLLNIYKYKYYR